MFDKAKLIAIELLKPAIRKAVQEEHDKAERRFDLVEARIAAIEQKPAGRDWVPIISLAAALITICLNTYFTYRIQWNPLFTETHLVNGSVTELSVTESRLTAEIIFSNEGAQTEVVYGGRFIYSATNVIDWNPRHSQSTNSISPFILKAGEMNHIQFSEPLLEGQQPPFKVGILLKTLSNGVPTDVRHVFGVVSRPELPLTDEAGRPLLTEKHELILATTEGVVLTRSTIITIPLLDYQKRRKR